MMGGTEEPCVSDDHLKAFALENGRDCPRVELDEDNHVAAELLMLGVGAAFDERMARPLLVIGPHYVASVLDGLPRGEREDVVRRVHAALSSEELKNHMSKAESRARSAAESEARRKAQATRR